MAEVRRSNVERGRLREECRIKLSRHIQNRLGIKIEPSQVRLKPSSNDPYAWKILPEKQEHFSKIFSKSLAAHSINAYRDLCEGVGVAFEAVPATHTSNVLESGVPCQEISFSSKIEKLLEENARLSEELCGWKENAITESNSRQLAEEEVLQLYEVRQQLQQQIHNYEITLDCFKNSLLKCCQGLETTLPVLQELKAGVSLAVSQ